MLRRRSGTGGPVIVVAINFLFGLLQLFEEDAPRTFDSSIPTHLNGLSLLIGT